MPRAATLQCAIIDYLEVLAQAHREDESLEVAIHCLRHSFGLASRPAPRGVLSPSLERIFDVGVALVGHPMETTRDAETCDSASSTEGGDSARSSHSIHRPRAASSIDTSPSECVTCDPQASANGSERGGDGTDAGFFNDLFMADLFARGFFEGVDVGSQEYEQRVRRAQEVWWQQFAGSSALGRRRDGRPRGTSDDAEMNGRAAPAHQPDWSSVARELSERINAEPEASRHT